jgi:hypothetical protein
VALAVTIAWAASLVVLLTATAFVVLGGPTGDINLRVVLAPHRGTAKARTYPHGGSPVGSVRSPEWNGADSAADYRSIRHPLALMFCMRPSRNPVSTLAGYAGLLLAATGLILSRIERCLEARRVVFAMGAPVLHARYGWAPAALLLALRTVQIRRVVPHPLGVQTPRRGIAPARTQSIAQAG